MGSFESHADPAEHEIRSRPVQAEDPVLLDARQSRLQRTARAEQLLPQQARSDADSVGGSANERCRRRILDALQFPQLLLYLLLGKDKTSPASSCVSELACRGFWTLNLASPCPFKYYINAHCYGSHKLKLGLELIGHFPTQIYSVEQLQFD